MIQWLLFLSVLLLVLIGVCLLKKPTIFLSLMNKSDKEENNQFLHQFGVFYLTLAGIGIVVGLFNLTFFSLFYIFSLLIISSIFSIMLAKKIL